MPILEVNGTQYPQHKAILRYLGTRFGYYSQDAIEQLKIDSFLDLLEVDIFILFLGCAMRCGKIAVSEVLEAATHALENDTEEKEGVKEA